MEIRENPWPNPAIARVDGTRLKPLHLQATNGAVNFSEVDTFRMYVCGITPYDATHLGHAATYLTFDLINRYQRARGSTLRFVENITDVDEPLLERATRDSVSWQELAEKETDLFCRDMSALRVFAPDHFVPVTKAMDLVDQMITAMSKNGYVYKLENDLYFRVSPFLSELPISESEAVAIFAQRGGDPDREGKEHPLDAVLWIANRNDEPGWESSHGFGRPGWHIECAAISLRYLLGEDFLTVAPSRETLIDLQGGGSDLIFPHHFMSGAQVKAATGHTFARAYVHAGLIGLDGEKMSKSKGNLVFVSKLLEQGEDPIAIRYALLQEHYSEDRMWTAELLTKANADVARVRSALGHHDVAPTAATIAEIESALADNLDTPRAFQALTAWVIETETGTTGDTSGELSRVLDALLGLAF